MNKLRTYLIKILLGDNKIDKTLSMFSNDVLSQKVGKLSIGVLAKCIEANENISDQQKLKIVSILNSPSQNDNLKHYIG